MRIAFFLTILMFSGLASPVMSQGQIDRETPVLLKADEVEHERDLNLVIARGNVELVQGKRILRANTVTYNQKDDVMTATGNVAILEPEGDVLFADHAEVTGDFKEGVAKNIRLLLSDNSRAAAISGRMSNGKVTHMRRGVYTPCQTCVGSKGTPLWQIKAYRITHDREEKTIEYRDAFIEMFGIPVGYTPYLSHPDPTVKRKSGLLPVSGGNNSELGTFARIPYFIVLDRDKDMTVELMPTTNGGQVLTNEYRQRFGSGLLEIDISGTITDIRPEIPGAANQIEGDNKARGHFFGHGRYHLSDAWRLGGDIKLSSDDTYLQRYSFGNDNVLESNLFVEGFHGDSYAAAKAYAWQDLRPANLQGDMPVIAPILNYHYVSPSTRFGGNLDIDADLVSLLRTNGTDSRRVSVKTTWNQKTITSSGHVLWAYASLQTDLYHASQVAQDHRDPRDYSSGGAARIYPRIGLDWRYPLESYSGSTALMIEPIAGVMASPRGGNPDLIPNEDSQVFEFDDTNLTSRNLFSGRDRVEGGQRAYVGIGSGAYGPGGYTSAFLGQTYRLNDDDTFLGNSGVDGQVSDYVGRVMIRPKLPIEAIYRFHLDKNNLEFKRNSVFLGAGPPALRLNLNYDFFDVSSGSGTLPDREEISFHASSQLSDAWSVRAAVTHDLINKFTSSQSFGLTYTCDCFTFDISYNRSFVRDREIKPTDTVLLQLTFKNLGTFATAQTVSQPETAN